MLDELIKRIPPLLHPVVEVAQAFAASTEVRYACGSFPDIFTVDHESRPAARRLWVRVRPSLNLDSPLPSLAESGSTCLHACHAAYVSDQPLLVTALLPHGVRFPSPRIGTVATLDHSMWFHSAFRSDQWLLYDMASPRAGSGRALATGSLYRPDTGALVASVAQQGVLKLTKPSVAATSAELAWKGFAATEKTAVYNRLRKLKRELFNQPKSE